MILRRQDSKILRNASGEIITDDGDSSSGLILSIQPNLQIPFSVLKGETNLVRQITDVDRGIAFVQNDPLKQRVYNHAGYYEGLAGTVPYNSNQLLNLGDKDWTIRGRYTVKSLSGYSPLLSNRLSGNTLGMAVTGYVGLPLLAIFMGGVSYTIGSGRNDNLTIGFIMDFFFEKRGNRVKVFRSHPFYGGVHKYYDVVLPQSFIEDTLEPVKLFYDPYTPTSGFIHDLHHLIIEEGSRYYDSALVGTEVDSDTNPEWNRPFTHLKRYKADGNKVFFLTSNYLKDAVIDSSNQITSIYDEFGGQLIDGGTNSVKNSNKGFLFNQSFLSKAGYTIGTNDFYIGFWVKTTDITDANLFQNSNITIAKSSSNYIVNSNTIGALNITKYTYISVLRKTGVLYWFINGVYFGSVADTSNYSLSNLVIGSNTFVGYIEDVLMSIGDSIINPAGYSVGDKVFQPPKRRSLDNRFIQFPIPV